MKLLTIRFDDTINIEALPVGSKVTITAITSGEQISLIGNVLSLAITENLQDLEGTYYIKSVESQT